MLSPLELLDIAQDLAARIPRTSDFSEERNVSWLAVGIASLVMDDINKAQRALENLDSIRVQARLSLDIGKWAGKHADSEVGRKILDETVSQFSTFEPWLARNDIADLVPPIFKVLGVEAVYSIARRLEDPFTAGNVHVMISYQLPDAPGRREQLLIAEKLALSVREGDRDWALRWVFGGYQWAGLTDDAERVRNLASIDPEKITRDENAILAEADKVLADSKRLFPQALPDTPLARLRRFLEYKYNDLKVIFLADACSAGSLIDPEMEKLIRSEPFQRVEPARPGWLTGDTSQFDAAGMANFLFGRPVCQHDGDRAPLEGQNLCDSDLDPEVFVRQMTGLFRDFGRLAEPFTPEQVEQGLWFVFGHPFWLRDMVGDRRVSPGLREECLRSMIHPFRDFFLPREDSFSGTAFYMWWDSLLIYGGGETRADLETISIDVIRLMLRLPGKGCQFAALHGLNHLYPNPAATALVQQFLEDHRASLTADEIGWIESCAIGDAM
ncbi:MAG TPA: hypothetical protein VKV95_20420 [Terriglobia bacterium]|nr:hypothetical protein [Terriglobia bacterium]